MSLFINGSHVNMLVYCFHVFYCVYRTSSMGSQRIRFRFLYLLIQYRRPLATASAVRLWPMKSLTAQIRHFDWSQPKLSQPLAVRLPI